MKILLVSMPSLHFFRWTEQLRESNHQIYWFNITDSGEYESRMNWIEQKFGWKLRWDFPGRFFIKNKFPRLYTFIQKFNEKNVAKEFEKYLNEVNPDVVHSFVMYMSCAPILDVMIKNNIKWIFSAWGNDLYYYQNVSVRKAEILTTLPRINYMFSDCYRDYLIARKHGFKGVFLGVYPGGGGYKLSNCEVYNKPFNERKIILVKGYETHFGRCNNVLQALSEIKYLLKNYDVVVFGANKKVIDFSEINDLKEKLNITIYKNISHSKIFELMGQSKFYIGNNISDGIPNTLLEAIIMDCFPIQSNPGGATAEIIKNGKNGLLIEKPEDVNYIKKKLILCIQKDENEIKETLNYNRIVRKSLDFEYIRDQVIEKYEKVNMDTNV